MTNRYRLAQLEDRELLATLPALVRRGNENTADLLAHLAELDERGLHLELGFPSLFAYCTESLGLCHSSAGRRIAAARVCRRFPELFDKVASGKLHLSALCSLKPHLNQENAAKLFEACSHKSSRQVDELLAARFPRGGCAGFDSRFASDRTAVGGPVWRAFHGRYRIHGIARASASARTSSKSERGSAERHEAEPSGVSVRAREEALCRRTETTRCANGRRSLAGCERSGG
jgi:hypothetical protein